MAITPSLVPNGIIINKIEYKKADYAVFHGDALSDIDLNIFLERLKKNIGRSELTTMNEAVISVYEENSIIQNQENETQNNSNQSLNNVTIKAKKFSITINLSDT